MEAFLQKEETIKLTIKFLLQKVQTRQSVNSAQTKINKILDNLQHTIIKEKDLEIQSILAKRFKTLKIYIYDNLNKCVTDTKPPLKTTLEFNLSDLFEEENSTQTMANTLDLSLAIKMVDKFAGSAETLETWISDVALLREHEADVPEANFLRFMRARLIGAARGVIDTAATIDGAYTALRSRFAIQLTPLAVEAELKELKQKKLSIADFGVEVEKLSTKLAAAHVSQGTFATEAAANPIVQTAAVMTFINGLNNRNAAFLTLSRNPKTLTAAVSTALEVNQNVDQESVFWTQNYNYSRGGQHNRGRKHRGNRGGRGNGRGGHGNHGNQSNHGNHGNHGNNQQQRGGNQRRGAQNAHVAQEVHPPQQPQQQQQPQGQPRREEANLGELFRE